MSFTALAKYHFNGKDFARVTKHKYKSVINLIMGNIVLFKLLSHEMAVAEFTC